MPYNIQNVPDGVLQWYIANNNKPRNLQAGFSSFNVSKAGGMVVSYHDQDGRVMHSTPSIAARRASQSNDNTQRETDDASMNEKGGL